MKRIANQVFKGERPLFKTEDAEIVSCSFLEGESPLKESKNLLVKECSFTWKYPFWYDKNIRVEGCSFGVNARAGMWYDENATFRQCRFEGPKGFRRGKDLTIEKCEFLDAAEGFWENDGVKLRDVKASGNYLMMNSRNIEVDGLELNGNYPFDGCENLKVLNSRLISKDAFWNCKNVEVHDSYIEGEYFGWNSENITLVNCEIHSHQGFCYIKNLKLINCKVIDSDLTFEYCENIDAEIVTKVDSIKNPISGKIKAKGCDELITDDPSIDQTKIEVILG